MSWRFRNAYGRFGMGMTPVVRVLLIANILVFFLQVVFDRNTTSSFTWIFGLSRGGIANGYLWQFVTYMFLHGPAFHLFMNMLVLFFMGPETERTMGTKHFVALYFLSGILGGLGWIIISPSGVPCVGASAAIFGILGAFAALYPNRPITLLLFFILPITMKAWVLVAGLTLFEVAALVSGGGGHIAYAAHVSGVVAGYAYARAAFRGGRPYWPSSPSRLGVFFSNLRRRRKSNGLSSGDIDRMLDKIAREGMGSLTSREREMLERASRSRRRG